MLYYSVGTLSYSPNKLILSIDPGINNFYRSLIPRWIPLNSQMYPPHISVVRKEIPKSMEFWGVSEGEQIEFGYSPIIQWGTMYYWLDCYSRRLEEIREQLGLPLATQYPCLREGFRKTFHTTLGNVKVLNGTNNSPNPPLT